jgi:alpha-glucoside transport system substrate-binding protein
MLPGCSAPGTGPPTLTEPTGASAQTVRILGSWEASELASLQQVLAPFEERTGNVVEFTTTRDLRGAIERGLAAGDPPEIAGLPGPGYLTELARSGQLVDLGTVIEAGEYKRRTAPAFVYLGTVDGRLVGVFLKGTVKGLLWFDPAVHRFTADESWSSLQHTAMTTLPGVPAWCIGLASEASSGWPGTDWIEDFVLRQSGPQVYDDWVAGRIRWTSPQIRWAFQTFGTVIDEHDVGGGVDGALSTHFSRAGDGLFTHPPQCLIAHQGTFMSTFLDEAVAREGGSYDFVPFPDIDPSYSGALIGAGDLVVMLHDTPAARDLLTYLLSPDAQEILVSQGGAVSGDVELQDYPSELLRRQAQLLADATIFRFDASDAMPEAMSRAFWQAVLDFTADQSRLDDILAELDVVQSETYGAG